MEGMILHERKHRGCFLPLGKGRKNDRAAPIGGGAPDSSAGPRHTPSRSTGRVTGRRFSTNGEVGKM